ncbi:MAG TPA: hypothetical protein PLI27_03510 [Ignavibacteriales bacterium]|nr:hypothetical protein [Ignavibacteriales bacterium]HOL80653.1 hypothetical protein [Ignavibacteriales bacterium]HOM64341.1 hypothetical protein [Ignavibacteriales bacterium]HPD67129.1 hypothetical protein [Ignavibacteriales bacterium]HPP33014.1 hypothetical protein [Ignavibacteriales bacterium]
MKILRMLIVLLLSNLLFAQADLNEAKKLINQEKFEKAKQVLLSYINSKPKDGLGYFYLGEIEYKHYMQDSVGNRNEQLLQNAKNWYLIGIKRDKRTDLNYFGAAKVYALTNHKDSLDIMIKRGLDYNNDIENVNDLLNSYNVFLEIENVNLDKAKEILDRANELDRTEVNKSKGQKKRNAAIFVAYGDLYTKLGNQAKALENYKSAINFDETFALGYYYYAEYYMRAKAYDAAKEQFELCIQYDPTFAKAFRGLAEIYNIKGLEAKAQNKDDLAKEMYNKFVEYYDQYLLWSEPTFENQLYYATRAVIFDDHAKALEIGNNLDAQFPNNYRVLRLLAYAYNKKGEMALAVSNYKKFFEVAPKDKINAVDYETFARYLMNAKDEDIDNRLEQAEINVDKAIELDNSKVYLYRELAIAYQKVNNVDKAIAYFEKVKSTGKVIFNDYFLLGNLYLAANRADLASEQFDKMIELRPDEALSYYYKANAVSRKDTVNGFKNAMPLYEKFLSMASPEKHARQITEVYFSFGGYYYSEFYNAVRAKKVDVAYLNDVTKKAEDFLSKVVQNDSSNDTAKKWLLDIQKTKTDKRFSKYFK